MGAVLSRGWRLTALERQDHEASKIQAQIDDPSSANVPELPTHDSENGRNANGEADPLEGSKKAERLAPAPAERRGEQYASNSRRRDRDRDRGRTASNPPWAREIEARAEWFGNLPPFSDFPGDYDLDEVRIPKHSGGRRHESAA